MPKFQCAVASDQRGEPIFATASQVRRWLLVEIRGSWGRDAVADTDLGRHVTHEWGEAMRSGGVRVVAIRRDLHRDIESSTRLFCVETGHGGWRSGTIWRRDIAGLHGVAPATNVLPTGGVIAPGWAEHDEPLVLVCTNGRHDSCCATFGRPLVRSLRESNHADSVWECSHIGGDRFAGNLVILPDGLYFGRCGPDEGIDVVDSYQRGRVDLGHFRGRATLAYPHQAAEYFTRRELNLSDINAVKAVRRVGDPANGTFAVDVADANADAATVVVTLRRTVRAAPSALTCTGPNDVMLPSYELVQFRTGPT